MRAPPVLVEKLVTDICICERIGETDDLTCHCECEKCSGQSCPLAKWSEAAAEFSDTKAQVFFCVFFSFFFVFSISKNNSIFEKEKKYFMVI